MEITTEPLAPWLTGALAVAGLLTVGYSADGIGVATRVALVVTLAALVTATALVAARSRARHESVVREHRQRPAPEQLLDARRLYDGDGSSYVIGMLGWVEAVNVLLDHAIASSAVPCDDLGTAREDTAELLVLLNDVVGQHPSTVGMARLHAACHLWEHHQPRVEAIAAAVDPGFHHSWRARTIIARRLRRGDPAAL
jgi:hypothetical protein